MGVLDYLYYAFTAVVCIQVIYYIFFLGQFAFLKEKNASPKKLKELPVSVIICSKNEAENLKNLLPSIISQDYSNFEVVLINDASQDKTLQVMESFSHKHQNIKTVNVKNTEAFWGNKKYALTLGIKVATNDYLLFTDADCKPVSKDWITEMTSLFSSKTSIVLGYGAYSKIKNSLLNKLVRFETLMTAIQYFSFAKAGVPYMGVGRNLAYTKNTFFNARGFMGHMKIRSGDDDLFVNKTANKGNTAVCFSKKSFTVSSPKTNFKAWIKQKRRHISTAKHYKLKHKVLLALIYVLNLLFWVLAIVLLAFQFKWQIVVVLFMLRMLSQFVSIGISAKKLKERDLVFLLPLLEIFLIISQLTIFINNLISKPNHWK